MPEPSLRASQAADVEPPPRMRFHSVDCRADRGEAGRINRGWWLHGVPRLIPLCRLLGHRPVVDGTNLRHLSGTARLGSSRWVVCDRCGIRTDPQGPLDADLVVGQRYTGDLPGPWPESPHGVVGGQLVLLGAHPGFSAQIKIGNAGSEQPLAAHLHLGRLGAFFVDVEDFGRGIQRRLNPRGYESRVVEVGVHDGRLRAELWARRDHWGKADPWWMHASVRIDPRELIWGPLRYRYEDVGEPVERTVRMADGDDHLVTLQLQRQSHGRDRLRHRDESWVVDWSASSPGISTKPHGGGVTASGVQVTSAAVENERWPEEAAAAIAARLTVDRSRYGYRAPVPA